MGVIGIQNDQRIFISFCLFENRGHQIFIDSGPLQQFDIFKHRVRLQFNPVMFANVYVDGNKLSISPPKAAAGKNKTGPYRHGQYLSQ